VDRYVVIGNPVSHSLSPAIHAHFAARTGEALEYGTLLVPVGKFMVHARRFFDEGGKGANVTLPFKVNAFHWAGARTARAETAEAANFLAMRSGVIEADNTDGAGLVSDHRRHHGVQLRGKRILIIGAGGAARGVVAPLLAEEPRYLVVANRTLERARELQRRFPALEAVSIEEIPEHGFDVVVNATSTSTHREPLPVPDRVFESAGIAYDMAYGPAAKAFVERALLLGTRGSDGLGMLVEQAAESFFLWRGRSPETAAILADLRARFA
jgi:shikimate dehydrogenase